MKLRHSIALLLAAACASGALAQGSTPANPAAQTPAADTTPKLASGLLMKQGGKLVFAPCRDRTYTMVDDISPGGAVTAALDSIGLAAGSKLYVELMGVLDGGMLRVSGINLARSEGRCQQPGGNVETWRASGNEPGWLLAVGPEMVVLKRLDKPNLHLPAAPVSSDNGVTRIELRGDGTHVKARFEHALCRDTMAEAVYGWTASVEVNGQVLKGCAWQR